VPAGVSGGSARGGSSGRSDGGQGGPADGDGIGARPVQCLPDVSRALVEQGDQQVPGIDALTQAAREQPGAPLRLRMEVGQAAARSTGRRCDDFMKRPGGAERRGRRPVSLGDTGEQVNRAAGLAELGGDDETAPYRLQARPAELSFAHSASMS